jgi:hypothetical protein
VFAQMVVEAGLMLAAGNAFTTTRLLALALHPPPPAVLTVTE